MTELDKSNPRSWATPIPPLMRDNPRTSIVAAVVALLMTGTGTGVWFMRPSTPPQDPLVSYRLEQIEKRLEKIEKYMEEKRKR